MKYYVYQLIDPNNNMPFYVGKGTGNRAWSHAKFKDGNQNTYKDRYIKKIQRQGKDPIVKIIKYFDLESEAYDYEEQLTEEIGLDKLTNLTSGRRPPSRKGWKPSKETLEKRSRGLKGIVRSKEWCENLSLAKQGEKNPMYGRKNPCSDAKKLAILKSKNLPNYDTYKKALEMLQEGKSVPEIAKTLKIGKGPCYRLANRTHGIFLAFPELI